MFIPNFAFGSAITRGRFDGRSGLRRPGPYGETAGDPTFPLTRPEAASPCHPEACAITLGTPL